METPSRGPLDRLRFNGELYTDHQVVKDAYERIRKERIAEEAVELPEFGEMLPHINFELIKELIICEYKKMGLEAQGVLFVDQDHVFVSNKIGGMTAAKYDVFLHSIFFSKEHMDLYVKLINGTIEDGADRADRDDIMEIIVLEILVPDMIHEEIHAISANSRNHISEKGRFETGTGFKSEVEEQSVIRTENTLFDEGVTEKWALELYREYCKRIGRQSRLIKNKADLSEKELLGNSYKMAQHFTDVFIERVGTATGVSAEVAWGALKRAKVEGGKNILDEFFRELSQDEELKDLFPIDTVEKIRADLLPQLLAEWNDPKIVSCLKSDSHEESTKT